jgi:ABC-2 type transport system ATP-binding protein
VIQVENLVKKFNGFTALQDINLEVNEGEAFAYLGPNGAGKSTTINIMATLLKPTDGNVKISGYDVTKDGMQIRRLIGYMPDDFGLYPSLSVYDNLDFAGGMHRINKTQRKEKIKELLDFFDLWEKKKTPVITLSKGMKQKLSLAKALIHNPKILFLDEPTSGLDPIMANEVIKLLLKLKTENKTIFMTTHLLSRAEKLCDSIALINEGRILCKGKIAQIKLKLQTSSLDGVYLKVMDENYG